MKFVPHSYQQYAIERILEQPKTALYLDMGLGKTLQAITLMQSRASQGAALVLMPTSLLHNWQQELRRFAIQFPNRNSPSEAA